MSFGRDIVRKTGEFFRLSPSEGRGILVLLPLLAVAGALIHGLGRPKSDPVFLSRADSLLNIPPAVYPEVDESDTLFYFDPNTVTIGELCRLGFELRTAASVIKYRDGGKVFEVPEDLAMCYGVTLEQYLRVEQYIVIDEIYRRKPRLAGNGLPGRVRRTAPPAVITVSAPFDPNQLDEQGFLAMGFTESQSRTIINYRRSIGGFSSTEQFGRCYAVTDEVFERIKPFLVFGEPEQPAAVEAYCPPSSSAAFPIELNAADSAGLRAVRGIGEVMVVRIMEYRERLGGFHSVEQLAEVKGMTEANYERIIQQITVDSCKIEKIDINFALPKDLVAWMERHPYATPRMAGKLLSARQLKGGYTNTQELVEDKIMTKGEAAKMAPYLLFKPIQTE